MITPDVIYLFEFDDDVVWADTDESYDSSGAKYIKADSATMSEIKAQAIEDVVSLFLDGSSYDTVLDVRDSIIDYANKIKRREMSEWIKFDKNDKSTWPVTLEMVNIYRKDDNHVTSAFFDSSTAFPHFKCHSGYEGEIYWQPLPEPPTN